MSESAPSRETDPAVPSSGEGSAIPPEFWSVAPQRLLEALASSTGGLSSAQAAARASRVRSTRGPSGAARALATLLAQFRSPITLMLAAAALLSLALGEGTDGLIILGILLLGALLGFWQEHRAAGAVDRLLGLIQTRATILRDGAALRVPVDEVVPGDVILLSAGASVPADALLLDSTDLYVDEAALTGESYPAAKRVGSVAADARPTERSNSVFLGTHVVSGTAIAVAVRLGAETAYGEIAARLALRPPQTEFEHGVRRFGYLLMDLALVLALTIFSINVALNRPALDSLLFTLALVVGLTPQLLPAIVSVTLARGAHRMAREKVIVRRLTSIEDLGGMEVLCTDKTGTLTESVIRVQGTIDASGKPSKRVRLLVHLNARFETGFANPIDDALRADAPPGAQGWTKLDEVPYDFIRKRLSVAVQRGEERLLITKVALANVLEVCNRAELPDGSHRPIEPVRAGVEARFAALSAQGYRCLGVACRPLAAGERIEKGGEAGMSFVGILSLYDPPKAGALEQLRALEGLGVRVKLVTGDNRYVAARIGGEVGLSSLLTGHDLHSMSESALLQAAPRTDIFAEVEPNQKERIILALKKRGLAVGYLGDRINDASALHAADVGISVDGAVDVTREAADVVLLEKDLGVLVQGVREGRRAFANTLKYVFITTSANFGNMVSMAGASLLAGFLPLLPKQILLINVLTDLPAMAIATDRLDEELVRRPRRWDLCYIRDFMLTSG
jgi:P-type Mg2+ transporter